ncbi:hypothetical protein CEXT_576901 [Caerostris extrusa]|uniref:Uncharacterized protein n=1 Tax=Caerostris extrusa TaxID=172846 RepID=A0AAV4XL09_CAEEX|nr:hypothetical protein CEXT_576901 [Caerostris extrusa]
MRTTKQDHRRLSFEGDIHLEAPRFLHPAYLLYIDGHQYTSGFTVVGAAELSLELATVSITRRGFDPVTKGNDLEDSASKRNKGKKKRN